MEPLAKLVRTYRFTSGLAERQRLAEQVFKLVEPDIRFYIFSEVHPPAGDDVLQEVLSAIASNLNKFEGNSDKQFWAWCYRIAANKIADHYRKLKRERLTILPPEDLNELIDLSTQGTNLSTASRHDLEWAIKLLHAARPGCSDLLWKHFVFDIDYAEIAEETGMSYDNVRIKIRRCLDEVKALVS